MPDDNSEHDSVEVELEDLLSRISNPPWPDCFWFEPGTAPPPAIQAGFVSGKLGLVDVQGDWYEHPHCPGVYIRIQNGKIAMPGFALLEEEERRVLAEVKEPMLLRGEFRVTQEEKHRRTIRRELRAALDDEKRRNTASHELPPNHSFHKKMAPLEDAISGRLEAGEQPGSNVPWASFCHLVRCDCDGFVDPEKKKESKRGYGDRTIKRIVKQKRLQRPKTEP